MRKDIDPVDNLVPPPWRLPFASSDDLGAYTTFAKVAQQQHATAQPSSPPVAPPPFAPSTSAKSKLVMLGVGGLVAVGLVAALMLRRKSVVAATANPRWHRPRYE